MADEKLLGESAFFSKYLTSKRGAELIVRQNTKGCWGVEFWIETTDITGKARLTKYELAKKSGEKRYIQRGHGVLSLLKNHSVLEAKIVFHNSFPDCK